MSTVETITYLRTQDLLGRCWTRTEIGKFLGSPDKVLTRGYCRAFKYALSRVEEVERAHTEISARRERGEILRAKWQKERDDEIAAWHARYVEKWESWTKAIPAACAALFILNRCVKSKTCPKDGRERVYQLKNGLIRLLYMRGYAAEAYQHRRECPYCHGSGLAWSSKCFVCKGAGLVTDVCFRFDVDKQPYCWHQPLHLVTFEVQYTADERDWSPEPGPWAATNICPIDQAASEDLLKWVIAAERLVSDEASK